VTPIAPVRKTVRVNASQARAFEVFTSRMSTWWPPTHSILKSPLRETVIEPRVGDCIGADGSVCDTGYVLEWQPPHGVVLAWQISAAWQFDPLLITEVEVRFIRENDAVTRVELEHRHLERMGSSALQARAKFDAPPGWSAIMEAYRQCVEP
jgi:uncharacterized protein YndB with AHSA1/START domain